MSDEVQVAITMDIEELDKDDEQDITLITMFFDIGRANWPGEFKRDVSFYVDSFKQYLQYPHKMVCFIDDRFMDQVLQQYISSPYKNKQFIPINRTWLNNNIRAWSVIENDRAIMESDEYKTKLLGRLKVMYPNGVPMENVRNHMCPENLFPEYNVINHSKIDLIAYAIENGYVTTPYTGWSDFGYFNTYHRDGSQLPQSTIDTKKLQSNKITFCLRRRIIPEDFNMHWTMFFGHELFIGAFYAGPTLLMKTFQQLYHTCIDEMHKEGVTDDDQHVYIQCFFRKPECMHLAIFENQDWPKALSVYQKT
jgi:hypothetical protein